MTTATYPDADALGAALKNLPADMRREIYAAPNEAGGYDIFGPPEVIAALGSEPSKEMLRAYAADWRWEKETGGITVGGAAIQTDRASQAMITGAFAFAQANPAASIAYKAADGFVMLAAAEVAAIANAVGAHVQACFSAEAAISAAIDAGTITSFAAIEAADWPT